MAAISKWMTLLNVVLGGLSVTRDFGLFAHVKSSRGLNPVAVSICNSRIRKYDINE